MHIKTEYSIVFQIAIQSRYQQKDKLIKQFKISYKKNGGPRTHIKQNANEKVRRNVFFLLCTVPVHPVTGCVCVVHAINFVLTAQIFPQFPTKQCSYL